MDLLFLKVCFKFTFFKPFLTLMMFYQIPVGHVEMSQELKRFGRICI